MELWCSFLNAACRCPRLSSSPPNCPAMSSPGPMRCAAPIIRPNATSSLRMSRCSIPSRRRCARNCTACWGSCAGDYARPAASIDALMPLGTGTALAIRSPAMLAIREHIAEHFHGALTAQDSHAPRLHITIQNKVHAAGCQGPATGTLRHAQTARFRLHRAGSAYLPRNPLGQPAANGRFAASRVVDRRRSAPYVRPPAPALWQQNMARSGLVRRSSSAG